MCVKTIVRIEPDPPRQPGRDRVGGRRQQVAGEEQDTDRCDGQPQDLREPDGQEALHHQAAAEGVEAEEDRQPHDRVPALVDAEPAPGDRCRIFDQRRGGRLCTAIHGSGDDDHRRAGQRIGGEGRPEARGARQPHRRPERRQWTDRQGADRGRQRRRDAIGGEGGRPVLVVGRLRQDGLVEALQAARLVARHGDHARQGDEDEEERICTDKRDGQRQQHQPAADAQDAAPPDAVAEDGDDQRQQGGPDERRREDRTDRSRAKPKLDEVEAEDDGPEPEAEGTDRLSGEHQPSVAVERRDGGRARSRHVRRVLARIVLGGAAAVADRCYPSRR